MLFSKLLGGRLVDAFKLPRLSQITNFLQLNKPKPVSVSRTALVPIMTCNLDIKFSSMIVKSASRSKVLRGPRKHQMLKKKADSLLRCGIQYQLPAIRYGPPVISHPLPAPITGKKRKAHQADDILNPFTSKRQRICFVRDFILEDPKSKWLKRGRYAILEKRDERQRAWKTGDKSFFFDSFSIESATSFDPFPAILQSLDFNSNNHGTMETVSLSYSSDIEHIMDSEQTQATVITTPISPINTDIPLEDSVMKDVVSSKPTSISPPPSIKKDVFKASRLRVPAPITPKSESQTTSTTPTIELAQKAQVLPSQEASEKLPPLQVSPRYIQISSETPSDSPNSTETPEMGININNVQNQAQEPQKEEEKTISEMTPEEMDAIIKKGLDEFRTEYLIKDMGTLFN